MIDHFGINCADLDAAKTFYDKVLGTLGYGRDGEPDFWISRFYAGNDVEAVCHTVSER